MRYTSNLTAPDLRPFFRLANPMLQRLGHDIPSDPDFDPNCGFLSDDEAAILFNIAQRWPKRWVDIGARFGWSTAHIAAAGVEKAHAVDPHFAVNELADRYWDNVSLGREGWHPEHERMLAYPRTSEEYFSGEYGDVQIDAAHIDGNHDAPEPTNDAVRAIRAGAQALVFHDFAGKPIRDAVNSVLSIASARAYKARIYWTPNLMAVAWRDGCGFVPPDHVRDPRIDWSGMERIVAEDFDISRCA